MKYRRDGRHMSEMLGDKSRLLANEKLKTYFIFNNHVGIAQSWCQVLAGLEL